MSDSSNQKSMILYKVIVKYYLYAVALISLITAMVRLQGFFVGWGKAQPSYDKYPALKMVEIGMAVMAVIIIILCLTGRKYLSEYKKKGVIMSLGVMFLYGIYNTLYDVLTSMVTHKNIISLLNIIALVASMLILVWASIYFYGRRELFT